MRGPARDPASEGAELPREVIPSGEIAAAAGAGDVAGSRPLVLGSSSRYRADLLGRLGVSFVQESPDVDERAFDGLFARTEPDEFALVLARAKADALARDGGDRWLLCADQVGVLEHGGERTLLTKPGDEERCVEQLMRLAGRTHALVNGIVLHDEATGERHERVDRQELTMRRFTRAEAERYVRAHRPLDSGGGYRVEDAGIALFERIRSDDFTGIIGLPLLSVGPLLRGAGLL